ncbi:MAG TPA: citrate transporter [Xanthobacteraceae bacterium]|jgi:Na+/H+ antiporter NhaD/arsenite permease-like protein
MTSPLSAVPIEFLLFSVTLVSVAIFDRRSLWVSLAGLTTTIIYKLAFTGFKEGPGLIGLGTHFAHEWVTLANLMMLLVGFAIVANHFEKSKLPRAVSKLLPDGWVGGLMLLGMVFCMSIFLDNIAAAVIGGIVARHVYQGQVGIGFLASIVAAANAGGAGSVIGDTTTTMMWLEGISPLALLPAFIAALVAFVVFGVIGSVAQHRHAPIMRHDSTELAIDWVRVMIVVGVVAIIITANVSSHLVFPRLGEVAPLLGLAIWMAILIALFARRPDWSIAPVATKGALFLVALVAIASLMPVNTLPPASWSIAFGLGLLSSVFDNIPLTALALQQGGYDWALLAYAVGFGGSMVWFGSSAGVALTGQFPEGRSTLAWMRSGWHVALAYLVGFFVMLALRGWSPGAAG